MWQTHERVPDLVGVHRAVKLVDVAGPLVQVVIGQLWRAGRCRSHVIDCDPTGHGEQP
jgi:hypothetical protein